MFVEPIVKRISRPFAPNPTAVAGPRQRGGPRISIGKSPLTDGSVLICPRLPRDSRLVITEAAIFVHGGRAETVRTPHSDPYKDVQITASRRVGQLNIGERVGRG
jgi:hypothetical protein